ncbi:hypothetical protein C8F01DRAFT_1229066 [Mycena amicta]|nr:hypothetical protein C8F01DRAFT_1229066 [Mycena amicta]
MALRPGFLLQTAVIHRGKPARQTTPPNEDGELRVSRLERRWAEGSSARCLAATKTTGWLFHPTLTILGLVRMTGKARLRGCSSFSAKGEDRVTTRSWWDPSLPEQLFPTGRYGTGRNEKRGKGQAHRSMLSSDILRSTVPHSSAYLYPSSPRLEARSGWGTPVCRPTTLFPGVKPSPPLVVISRRQQPLFHRVTRLRPGEREGTATNDKLLLRDLATLGLQGRSSPGTGIHRTTAFASKDTLTKTRGTSTGSGDGCVCDGLQSIAVSALSSLLLRRAYSTHRIESHDEHWHTSSRMLEESGAERNVGIDMGIEGDVGSGKACKETRIGLVADDSAKGRGIRSTKSAGSFLIDAKRPVSVVTRVTDGLPAAPSMYLPPPPFF